MAKTDIFIALPTFGGSVTMPMSMSVLRLSQLLIRQGIHARVVYVEINGIDSARNVLASRFLSEGSSSHLLFYDDDMNSPPTVGHRLVGAGKDIVGYACVRRSVDLRKIARLGKSHSPEVAVAKAMDFNVHWKTKPTKIEISNGMCIADGIGMALTLISRSTLERMVATSKIRTQIKHRFMDAGLKGPLYGFFDPIRDSKDDITEDFSFCLRAKEFCNIDTWVIMDEAIGHIGPFEFSARYIDNLSN